MQFRKQLDRRNGDIRRDKRVVNGLRRDIQDERKKLATRGGIPSHLEHPALTAARTMHKMRRTNCRSMPR